MAPSSAGGAPGPSALGGAELPHGGMIQVCTAGDVQWRTHEKTGETVWLPDSDAALELFFGNLSSLRPCPSHS